MPEQPLHVAIIGGGLCGLSLAIALEQRSISYTIYETRASFTEIGAGINLGPNTIKAFGLIDPVILDAILHLATKNEAGSENLWFRVRLGAPTERFSDGHAITDIVAPTAYGSLTTSRNEILQLLARNINSKNARFNKKICRIDQSDDSVLVTFEDGTQDTASLVIGCDGAHSTVRQLVLGPEHPATAAKFSHTGGYRAVLPMQNFEQIVGADKARMSSIWCGPGSYLVHYPIDGGKNTNIGLWSWKKGEWEPEAWVLPKQKPQMLKDFEAWGGTVQKLMQTMDDETAFWATFHHSVKPESYFSGRICMIGDASHGMCPHQGQGAAQSMEDACVMAEVLRGISTTGDTSNMSDQITAAFSGYESVRKPRFERCLDTSFEAFSFWSDFWRPDLSREDLDVFSREADERMEWIWQPELEVQGKRAKEKMREVLLERANQRRHEVAKLA